MKKLASVLMISIMSMLFAVPSFAHENINKLKSNKADLVNVTSLSDYSNYNDDEKFDEEINLMKELLQKSNNDGLKLGTKKYQAVGKDGNIVSLTVTNLPRNISRGWVDNDVRFDKFDVSVGDYWVWYQWEGSYMGTIKTTCDYTIYRGSFSNSNSIRATGVSTSYTSPSGWSTTTEKSYNTDSQLQATFNGYFFHKKGTSSRDIWMEVELSPYGFDKVDGMCTLKYWK